MGAGGGLGCLGAKREGEEAGRARGECAEGVGCVWGGWIAFWGGIKRLYETAMQ